VRSLLTPKRSFMSFFGGGLLAVGLYNVHALAGVTEGGILGMTLFLQHWFDISPAWSGLVMNGICYFIGWRLLGSAFIAYSAVAGGSFSLIYAICEAFPPVWPGLAQRPLAAALLGAVFVGVSIGISVRAGGAPGGDDALAMSISHVTGWKIQWAYLASDLSVLALSATYIDLERLAYSLLTVMLSGQIIGLFQKNEPEDTMQERKVQG